MYDFITIDFETANENLNSACSVGIVAVENLEIVDYFESYIQPPHNRYSDRNIQIHGITPDMTEQAPRLDELWFDLSRYFSVHVPVVAHNAHFDMSVLRLSTSADIPNFPYVDSIKMASQFVQGSKSLGHCAECFGIEMDRHHDALSDATAAAEIVIHILKECDCVSMWEFLAYAQMISIKQFSELVPQEKLYAKKNNRPPPYYDSTLKPSQIVPTCEIDKNHPLYGKSIVFTGELSMPRNIAWQIAVNCGAVIRTSVSRKTDYLIVGTLDPAVFGENYISEKHATALKLNLEGKADIKILSEDKFLALVS